VNFGNINDRSHPIQAILPEESEPGFLHDPDRCPVGGMRKSDQPGEAQLAKSVSEPGGGRFGSETPAPIGFGEPIAQFDFVAVRQLHESGIADRGVGLPVQDNPLAESVFRLMGYLGFDSGDRLREGCVRSRGVKRMTSGSLNQANATSASPRQNGLRIRRGVSMFPDIPFPFFSAS
jgi:hypothetical protein